MMQIPITHTNVPAANEVSALTKYRSVAVHKS
jgi:hypothetical protein